jgi:hypothetical protein
MRYLFFLLLFLETKLLAGPVTCVDPVGKNISQTWKSVKGAIQFQQSCKNPANGTVSSHIQTLVARAPSAKSTGTQYLEALKKYHIDCFTGPTHPGLVCLQMQGKKIYACGQDSYCYNDNGLLFRAKSASKGDSGGLFQWEIFEGQKGSQRPNDFGELVGRVNLNFETGAERVWLSRKNDSNGMLMDKFDLSPSREKADPAEICRGLAVDPSEAVRFTGVDVKGIAAFQSSIWKNYRANWNESLSFLKGEAVGVRKATWDVLAALGKKDTWTAMRKALGDAGSDCFTKHNGNGVQWVGCMTIKFGKTMVDGITKAAKECFDSSFGRNSTPEKAGECMGKAIGMALGTGIGTKGLSIAVDATKGAQTVVGKALGNAAQLAAKCVGEVCGLSAGKMELGLSLTKKSATAASTTALTTTASTTASTTAKSTGLTATIERSTEGATKDTDSKPKLISTLNEDHELFDVVNKVAANDPSFATRVSESSKKLSTAERKEFASTLVNTFKSLNPPPAQGIKESKKAYQLRLQEYHLRHRKVAKVAFGFVENGVRDSQLITKLLNDQSWSKEALEGVDRVLSKSRSEFKEKVQNGKPPTEARSEAARSAIAELSQRRRFEDLSPEARSKVEATCQCIGMCPLRKAAGLEPLKANEPIFHDDQFTVCAN